MPGMTITTPGVYSVTSDITVSAGTSGIVVAPGVHGVRILLYSRIVSAGTTASAASISAGIECNGSTDINIIGMGGSIRDFAYGVRADNCHRLAVDNVAIENAWFRGIAASGLKPRITNNRIDRVGGCTAYANAFGMGVEWQSSATYPRGEALIQGNTIDDVFGMGTGEGCFISLSDYAGGSVVKGNVCRGDTLLPNTFAVWCGNNATVMPESDAPVLTDNEFVNMRFALGVSSTARAFVDRNTYRNCQDRMWQPNPLVEFGPTDSL